MASSDEDLATKMNEMNVIRERWARYRTDKLGSGSPAVRLHRFENWDDLVKALLSDDNRIEQISLVDSPGFFSRDDVMQAAVSAVSTISLRDERLSSEMIQRLDAAILHQTRSAAKAPVRLKTLILDDLVDVEAKSSIPRQIERIFLSSDRAAHDSVWFDVFTHPACSIWDLSIWELSESNKWLPDVLVHERCSIRRLATHDIFPLLSHALGSSACKLEGLQVFSTKEGDIFGELITATSIRYLQFDFRDCDSDCFSTVSRRFPRLTHLVGSSMAVYTENLACITQLLGDPECSLHHFEFRPHEYISDETVNQVQDAILSSVESNYKSRIQVLDLGGPWKSKLLEQRWAKVKYRNTLSNHPILRGRELVRPSTAKLFMCGHTGSGKTTISTNLKRTRCLGLLKCLPQYHPSTQGIQRTSLTFDNKNKEKLLIYDLAGQELFHAFHHYFIRGSDKNVFIVVCKVHSDIMADADHADRFKTQLRYWLRFIVSHQSAKTNTRPKVLVVLNDFSAGTVALMDARALAEHVADGYREKLDFKRPADDSTFFELNALDAKQVQHALRPVLKEALNDILKGDQVQRIPWTCEGVIQSCKASPTSRHWYRDWLCGRGEINSRKVVQLDNVFDYVGDLGQSSRAINSGNDHSSDVARYTLTCLHEMGEAIYLGAQEDYDDSQNANEDSLLIKNSILDMPWFVEDLLKVFIPPQAREDTVEVRHQVYQLNKYQITERLKSKQVNITDIPFLLKVLHAMGVLIPVDDDIPIEDTQRASQIIVATLLYGQKFPGLKKKEDSYCWGRRLQPVDNTKDFVLLPSGVFTIIQAKVKHLCHERRNTTFELGDGWVDFEEDRIQVVVKVGGDNDRWMDRQWVDIMIVVPKEDCRCIKAEEILTDIQDCIFVETNKACPYVKLDIQILNPGQLMLPWDSRRTMEYDRLSNILWMAKENGLDYFKSWKNHEGTKLGELLLPGELQKLVQARKLIIEEAQDYYNNRVLSIYPNGPRNEDNPTENIPTFDNEELSKLFGFMFGQFNDLRQDLKQLKLSIDNIVTLLEKMERSLKSTENKLLELFSTLLRSVKVSTPKLPHLKKGENLFPAIFGEEAELFYLCEYPKRCHHVKEYPGVQLILPRDWFQKYGKIFEAVTGYLFLLMKFTSIALPGGTGQVVNETVNLMDGGLKTVINSCMGGDMTRQFKEENPKLSPDDLIEVFEFVKQRAPQGYQGNMDLLMNKCFGLYRDKTGNAWLCKEHRDKFD